MGHLRGSVGEGGANRPEDVTVAQALLQSVGAWELPITGVYDGSLALAVKAYQLVTGQRAADGLMAPGGPTEKDLTQRMPDGMGDIGTVPGTAVGFSRGVRRAPRHPGGAAGGLCGNIGGCGG
ncbi:MAG: peptidoglycan-binding domain-containing protein [Magnetospiraceae bacterium]